MSPRAGVGSDHLPQGRPLLSSCLSGPFFCHHLNPNPDGITDFPGREGPSLSLSLWGNCSRAQGRSGWLGQEANRASLPPLCSALSACSLPGKKGRVPSAGHSSETATFRAVGSLQPPWELSPPTPGLPDPGWSTCLLCHGALVHVVGLLILGQGGRWQKGPNPEQLRRL